MKREAEIKDLLISNAIHLIAEGGFEKATTKELTYCRGHLPDFKMNEVYIYRIFGSKERLFESVFLRLDQELFCAFQNGMDSLVDNESETKKCLYILFSKAWRFILGNEERCRCYVRYYYSIYFKGESLLNHRKHFQIMVDKLSPFFKEEANVDAVLHSVFTTLLDFAIRVYNGELKDDTENQAHIFNVLYCMMVTYLKNFSKAS